MPIALKERAKVADSGMGLLCIHCVGDPVSIFHHLGLGFWSFLSHPAAGLVESARGQGPQRIAAGFAGGLQSLVSNTIFAFSSAAAKASGSARKVSVITHLAISCIFPKQCHQLVQHMMGRMGLPVQHKSINGPFEGSY